MKAATRSIAKRELSESAMDAVFDSFVGSPLSIVADRQEVDEFSNVTLYRDRCATTNGKGAVYLT